MVEEHKKADVPLHPLGVVHIPRLARVPLPEPYGPVIRPRNEFFARRTPVAPHDSADVAFIDLRRGFEVPDVESVEVVVF